MKLFESTLQSGSFQKCCFPVVMFTCEKGSFLKMLMSQRRFIKPQFLGMTQQHFVYLFLDFEYQLFLVDRNIFKNAPSLRGHRYFHMDKKRFQNYLDTCGWGLNESIES